MKPIHYVTGLLLFSFALNAYYFIDKRSCCENKEGYGRIQPIDDARRSEFNEKFRAGPVNTETYAGVISRSVFEEFLCNDKVNGIYFEYAIDPTGSYGPLNNGPFIMFTGAYVEYDQEADTIRKVHNLNLNFYANRHWCPPSCLTNDSE